MVAAFAVYDRLSRVSPGCGGRFADQTPARFVVRGVDSARYRVPRYETVRFPSRAAGITISGWFAGAARPDAPAVILVHGLGGCKRDPAVLLAAGMLHRAGFAVLAIDLRDHGDSTVEDGRYAGGVEEHVDVLGAWDWLVSRAVPPGRIGLFGFSLGASTVVIAAGAEPRVAAVWEDSGYSDIDLAIRDELTRSGYPAVLAPASFLVARVVSGDDLAVASPLRSAASVAGRPVFITHGGADSRMPVKHALALAAAIGAAGGVAERWIVPGADHVEAISTASAEYERRLVAFFRRHLGPAAGEARLADRAGIEPA